MTDIEKNKASQIVDSWFWQPAEGHNYRYRGALRTLVRFYESVSMEPDVLKLVIEYLRDQELTGGISLMNRTVDLGSGWKAMDAWYQTAASEKWAGTESTKVRVYQVLMQAPSSTSPPQRTATRPSRPSPPAASRPTATTAGFRCASRTSSRRT